MESEPDSDQAVGRPKADRDEGTHDETVPRDPAERPEQTTGAKVEETPSDPRSDSSTSPEKGSDDHDIQQKFSELDADNSGSLDVNELAQLIKELLENEADDGGKKKMGAKQLRKLQKKALDLAGDVLKEMDEDKSGSISYDEFAKWWKDHRAKKSKGMFRGLFGKRKKAKSDEAQPAPAAAAPQLFGRSLVSLMGKEPDTASVPAFVQFLFDRIDDWPGSLAAEQLFSGIPSRQALDSKTR